MKIIFWVRHFAVPSLKILLENNHKILAVVTAPDKERGKVDGIIHPDKTVCHSK